MSAGPEKKPIGYNAASSALMNAIERKRLPAHIVDIRDELFDKPVGGSLGLIEERHLNGRDGRDHADW
jgi:hypothetical protein